MARKIYERNGPHLAELHPSFRLRILALMGVLAQKGILVLLTRSYASREAQRRLHATFLAGDGPRAAPENRSWHRYRLAIDGIPFRDADSDLVLDREELTWDVEVPVWEVFAKTAEELGMRSGSSFGDWPHVEWHPGLTIDQAEALGSYSLDNLGIWRRIFA
ncbi:hypothetical protein LCGC14_0427490 [marine sediment metagenome]|uniref:Peptidase M15C domain-containing protein n=1 Tax=marine sediment metagenome TaxID=412755 RepID=A0A0F9SV53_9ZZZZ